MFTVWSQTLSNFKLSSKTSDQKYLRLNLPLKLTQIDKQIVYR